MQIQEQIQEQTQPQPTLAARQKAVRILAKSLFRELTAQGYNEKQIVNLATELISEVTTNIASKSASF